MLKKQVCKEYFVCVTDCTALFHTERCKAEIAKGDRVDEIKKLPQKLAKIFFKKKSKFSSSIYMNKMVNVSFADITAIPVVTENCRQLTQGTPFVLTAAISVTVQSEKQIFLIRKIHKYLYI